MQSLQIERAQILIERFPAYQHVFWQSFEGSAVEQPIQLRWRKIDGAQTEFADCPSKPIDIETYFLDTCLRSTGHGFCGLARKKLLEMYKSSYAFRDKLDTDGFDHPQKIFDLTEALIRRGYSDANITAVLGGNFRRLLGSTWV